MRLSERIYRTFLKAYPKRYLQRYGEPMAQLFSDQLGRTSGAGASIRLWLRTLGDLSRTVPARHFERLRPNRGAFGQYNEAARRSLFFARYEAASSGHGSITPEDLLAGLLRADRDLRSCFTPEALNGIRQAIGTAVAPKPMISVGDLPLNDSVKQILSLAAVEAEASVAKGVTTRHLAAAILSHGKTSAAELLRRSGIDLDRFRDSRE